jgi:O-antigen/teichoic acid export membrane protein
VYAVAARLSEVWYFVPVAIGSAVFPAVIRAKDTGEELYRQRLRQLYGAFAWAAIGVALVVTFLAGPVIDLLYDDAFAEAADVLVVHVWTAPFTFMGVVFSKWLIIEGLLLTSLVRHGFGAALNIGLNILLIPEYGPVGSAFASLASYAAATYGASFLSARTRPAAIDMTIGLLYPLYVVRRRLLAR